MQLSNPFYTSLAFQDFYFLCLLLLLLLLLPRVVAVVASCCCCSCCYSGCTRCVSSCLFLYSQRMFMLSLRVRFGFVFCVCLLAIFIFAFLSTTVCTRLHELQSAIRQRINCSVPKMQCNSSHAIFMFIYIFLNSLLLLSDKYIFVKL